MNQSSKTARTRLLIDVTIAATTELNTGIQRVVRNITRHTEELSEELGLECVPVICHGEQLSAVGYDGRPRIDERITRDLLHAWMSFHRAIARGLSRWKLPLGERYLAGLSRLRKLFIPKTLVRKLGNSYRKLTGRTIEFRRHDVLVLLDASWDLKLQTLLELAKSRGVSVVTVVYDLIPILYPQFHPEQLRGVFQDWFEKVLRHSDLMLGISQTVRDDLKSFTRHRESKEQGKCELDWFRLGADFSQPIGQVAKGQKDTVPFPFENHELQPYYLAVGTIEPRKNHAFLLDAFDQLWRSGSDAKLVVVGKIGWMCEKVAERIRCHPEINHRLFFADQVNDQQLSRLYSGAKALVFPSVVEGFGLPIVEAFQHRIPVLVSDTRIHREVAGNDGCYFGLDHSENLVQLINEIESGDRTLQVPATAGLTWKESCHDFLSKIRRHLDNRRQVGSQSNLSGTVRTTKEAA